MGKKEQKGNMLSVSKLDCKINDFDAEILQSLGTEHKDEIYTKFVHRFLNYIPVDYRSATKAKIFSEFAQKAYKFFKVFVDDGNSKIEINKSDFNGQAGIDILILENNIPFVIDSLNILLTNLNLQTAFIFHPVISCIRDDKGKLKDIMNKYDRKHSESLIYIKAIGDFDSKFIDEIKKQIQATLQLVSTTLESWKIMLDRTVDVANELKMEESRKGNLDNQRDALKFLNWLQSDNITFLGIIDFDAVGNKITKEIGVKKIWQNNIDEILSIVDFSKNKHIKNSRIMLGKINKISPVHRNVLIDYILIKRLDKDGNYNKGIMILGLYGTAIYYQSIQSIPILNKKVKYVVETSNFPSDGYNIKKIKNIIESLPRDVLIQVDERDLYCMSIHMLSAMLSHKLKLFIQQDWSQTFLNILVFMPREKLTPEVYRNIINYFSKKFDCGVISDNVTVVSQGFVHLFATISICNRKDIDFSLEEMQQDLVDIVTNWSDELMEKLHTQYGEYEGGLKYQQLEGSFSNEYRYRFGADDVLDDLPYMQRACNNKKTVYNLLCRGEEFSLKIYSPERRLILSEILPSIESLGFIAADEQSFFIRQSEKFSDIWLYEFKLSSIEKLETDFSILKQNVENALEKIDEGELPSDDLCKLITLAEFDWVRVKLIKALTVYLHQTGFIYSKEYVQNTLIKHSNYTRMIFELFEALFSPQSASQKAADALIAKMNEYLDKVDSSVEDKILVNMKLLIQAILRTNFYQKTAEGGYKSYFSFKFRSENVPDLPLPKPFAEIFVFSKNFEGIHLRGGKVARGGIRWSDRGEDYRREVLGLMKAQMTKNTIIVPTGSKGSFYVKFLQGDLSREEYMQKVVMSYQNFLRGLLDLTDNLVDNKIIQPKDTVIYDEQNPYLVVAADKGTASFSDYANEVSAEYNFWLNDAFASGGSVGYDHKKMGITAKGAWISVQSHFMDQGHDVQKEPFTVVGIGDMSGDVFGNGMLLSKYIKLVAAFNHMHIFIDPNPDPAASFKERQRMFKLPRSSWMDYDKKLISTGGGVFNRSAKTITLTEPMQKMLDCSKKYMSPDELIRQILKMQVDLVWNGGIGTYIKASQENNIDIGDKANDNLRIDGAQVRARVVAEGGNLGVSQLGRVEYALNHGAINTDFIDNSGGVDCSDHEVNIKIALNQAVECKKISRKQRDQLLADMTKPVEKLVLQDNCDQHLAITIASLSHAFNIESFSQLIKQLENVQLLDSKVEFLPSKTEMARRFAANEGITRPELAVLLSYSKIYIDFELSNNSELTKDPHFDQYLLNYFPEVMRDKFKKEILNHPLREEIIRTIITNKLVNRLAGPTLNAIIMNTGASAAEIARAYEVVVKIFDLDNLWQTVTDLGPNILLDVKVEMFTDMIKSMRRGINWFIRHTKSPINIDKTIEQYENQVSELSKTVDSILEGTMKSRFYQRQDYYIKSGVKKDLANSIALLDVLISAFDIIFIAKQTKSKLKDTASTYFECGEKMSLDWLRYTCENQISDSYWNRVSLQSLKDDFYDKQKRLVCLYCKDHTNVSFEEWVQQHKSCANIFLQFIEEIKTHEVVDLNMIILANKKLEIMVRKFEAGKWL